MARVSDDEVRAIVDSESTISMTPFIQAATNLVNRVEACAIDRGVPLTPAELAEVERWLAAHLYVHRDPLYSSRSTADASGSFKTESYLDTAKMLDPSGCLELVMSGNKKATLTWLGKPRSDQIDYHLRD